MPWAWIEPCQGDVRACPGLACGTMGFHVLGPGVVPRDMGACLGLASGPFEADVRDSGARLA